MTFNGKKKSRRNGLFGYATRILTRPIDNVARRNSQDVDSFWLVGEHIAASVYLPRSIDWLDGVIARQEVFGANPAFYIQQL